MIVCVRTNTPFRLRATALSVAALCAALIFVTGCASSNSGGAHVYRTPTEGQRNPLRAQELTMRAAELLHEDPAKAEELLREALTADLYHGPAHNNLGVAMLGKGLWYEAANEFEWARKLMPGHPDPRMNLALTLERAGRVDEALATYDTALEVYPHHVPTMQALTRLQLRHQRADDRTSDMLKEIAMAGETAEWREWAREQMIRVRVE
jgi:Flp pilus assembly protein TadD